MPLMPRRTLSPRVPPVVIAVQRESDERHVAQGVVHDGARDGEQADGQAQGYGQQGAAQGPLCAPADQVAGRRRSGHPGTPLRDPWGSGIGRRSQ